MEEQQLDDHYLCTDIDRMENIARQVPLSAMERPAWDTKVLESLGVCSIQTDSEIWKRVWSEEERLNYAIDTDVSGARGKKRRAALPAW